MKNIIIFLSLCLSIYSVQAQTVFGKWNTLNKETGKIESIVEVYRKDGKAYAKIIKLINESDKNNRCTACKGKNKNKPILGMIVFNGLKQGGNEWNGGKILDPNNGKYYKCYISLANKNKLKIRGYVGISLLGRTDYWYRAKN